MTKRILLAGAVALAGLSNTALAQRAIAQAQPIRVGQPVVLQMAVTNQSYFQGSTVKQRLLQSTWVVSGTIKAEKDTVDFKQYPQAPVSTTYKVFTLNVTNVLLGDEVKSITLLVGPADPAQIPFDDGSGRVNSQPSFRPWLNNVQVIDGQEGIFFVTRHPAADKYSQLVPGAIPLNALDTKYKENVAVIEKVQAVLKDPIKALKAKKAEDRFLAAQTLVQKYRAYPPNATAGVEEVAIDAHQSKLILAAILEGDFAKYDKPVVGNVGNEYWENNPANLTGQLGLYAGAVGFPQFQAPPGAYNATFKDKLKEYLDSDAGKKYVVKSFKARSGPANPNGPTEVKGPRIIK
jgi:hypothetical protein